MLTDKQIRCVHMLVDGQTISDISRVLGVSRQSIYSWKEKEEFIAEMDKQVQKIKVDADKRLTSNLSRYIKELEKIAFNSKNEKTKSTCLMYLVDRVLGKCTTKADINIDKESEEEINWDDITQLKRVK